MFLIRKASIDDASQIAHIHIASWAETYQGLMPKAYIEGYTLVRREALWRKIISQNLSEVWVAEVDSRLVGFLSYDTVKEEGAILDHQFELSSLYVLSQYQAIGIGRGLYQVFEARLQTGSHNGLISIKLWVLNSNLKAVGFYQTLGFSKTGRQLEEVVFDMCLVDHEMVKVIKQKRMFKV